MNLVASRGAPRRHGATRAHYPGTEADTALPTVLREGGERANVGPRSPFRPTPEAAAAPSGGVGGREELLYAPATSLPPRS
jgi:hypothetical protein